MLAALGLICAVLIAAVVVKTRDDAALAARESAAYTAPPVASTPPEGKAVTVIGDDVALRAASDVPAARRWPGLLSRAADAEVTMISSAGAGYSTGGTRGRTFVQAAASTPAASDVILFIGGAADRDATALALAKAATQAFAAARERAPEATVVVIGPVFVPSGVSAKDIDAVRTVLRSAARIADARWVDPVGAGWVPTAGSTADLGDAAQRTIAARIDALLGARTG